MEISAADYVKVLEHEKKELQVELEAAETCICTDREYQLKQGAEIERLQARVAELEEPVTATAAWGRGRLEYYLGVSPECLAENKMLKARVVELEQISRSQLTSIKCLRGDD